MNLSSKFELHNQGCYTVRATLLVTCLAIVLKRRNWELFSNSAFLLAAQQTYARQVVRGMLHCAMARKCVAVAAIVVKSRTDSTSCSASCNKNVAFYEGMLHLVILLATCMCQQHCETS